MQNGQFKIYKNNSILILSVALFIISIGLITNTTLSFSSSFQITNIDIRQISPTKVANKNGIIDDSRKIVEVKLGTQNVPASENNQEEKNTKGNDKPREMQEIKNISNSVPTKIWYLPTEYGIITTYPNYYHVAFDITSPRGSNEIIYPIANGQISSIYTDNAGALIVTVRHYINGVYYTSQYAHLSRYADIYVGKEVTPFTPLGWMGTTGISTGNHLHIALLDCNLYGDDKCPNLNEFFHYSKNRFNSGFSGIGNVMDVPYQWWGR